MGDTQSAQREDRKDGAAEPEETEEDGVQTEKDADNQPLKSSGNFSETNGKADSNVAACNGHLEDESAADDEDCSKIVKSIKDEDTHPPKVATCQDYNEANANENAHGEIIEIEEEQNEINETFRKLFSNIKFKLTVKRGSTDNVETAHLTDPMTTEDFQYENNDKPISNSTAAAEIPDNDSTTCLTLTDNTSEILIESPGTNEDINADGANAVAVFSSGEDNKQKEVSIEKLHSTTCPIDKEKVPDSPFKSFFTTGLFSSLQKKRKEPVKKQEKEMEEVTELAPQNLSQEYEITVGVEAGLNDFEEDEVKYNTLCATSPQLTDASPSISPSTCTVPVADILNSQENKIPASPLKRLLSGGSLKRLSRKPRSRRSSDGRLSVSGENSSDHYLSSTESADSQKSDILTQPSSEALKADNSAWESFKIRMTPKKCRKKPSLDNEVTQTLDAMDEGSRNTTLLNSAEDTAALLLPSKEADGDQKEESQEQASTKASDEGSAWYSFKKLLTPKKHVKKPSLGNEETLILDEVEIKPNQDMATSDHSTEEEKQGEKKRKDLSVSWEAVLCGSGKKRSTKKSDSASENPQINAGTNKEDSTEFQTSNEVIKPLTQSPNQVETSPESDEGSTWKSFKKLVTPKRRAKHEDENKDYKEPEDLSTREETFSFRKLLLGRKKRLSIEKQELLSEVDRKPTFGDDEEFETPAVVPLSEFETDIPLQTQTNNERFCESEAVDEIHPDRCKEIPEQIPPRKSQIEIENAAKNDPLPIELPMELNSNEESDENTETISKQQLSDIPEEGTETMANPASPTDQATRDDTTAEDLIELTSEAITAPEPSDVSVTDETDMVSAVSQLPESSKTSGNTTPVPAEHQDKDTEMLLKQAAETIEISTSAGQMFSEKPSAEGIVYSVWNQILKSFRKDKTTIKMDLNEESKDTINVDAAEAETMNVMIKDLSEEIISGVSTREVDLAENANEDGVHQLKENEFEPLIKKLEDSQNIGEYIEKTTSTEQSLQVKVVISDHTNVAFQTEVEHSKTPPEKIESVYTMREEIQDKIIKPNCLVTAGTDTQILPDMNEGVKSKTEESTPQLVKKMESVSKDTSVEQTELKEPIKKTENITESLEEVSVKHDEIFKISQVQEQEVLENILDRTLDSEVVSCHQTQRKNILEVIFATEINKKEVQTEANIRQEDTFEIGPGQETQELKAGEDTFLDFADGTSSVIETKQMSQVLSTAETSQNAMEKLGKVNVRLELISEIGQNREPQMSEDVEASTFDQNVSTSKIIKEKDLSEDTTQTEKEETNKEIQNERTIKMMSQCILETPNTIKKEEHKNETTPLDNSDNDQVVMSESYYREGPPRDNTKSKSEVEETKFLKRELTPDRISDEKTPLTEDREDSMDGFKTTDEPMVSEALETSLQSEPIDSPIPEEQVYELGQTWGTVGDEGEVNDEPVSEASEPQLPKEEVICDAIQAVKQAEEKVSPLNVSGEPEYEYVFILNTGPNNLQNGKNKDLSEAIKDLDSNSLQTVESTEFFDGIQATEPESDKTVSSTEDNDGQANLSKIEDVQRPKCEPRLALISDSDLNTLQMVKNEELSEGIQVPKPTGEIVALNKGNNKPKSVIITKDVQEPERSEAVSDTFQIVVPAEEMVSPLNNSDEPVIAAKNESIQEPKCEEVLVLILDSGPGIQVTEQADKTVSLTNSKGELVGGSQTEYVQEPVECETVSDVISDLDPNNDQMFKNEGASESTQAAEQADKTVTLTDGDSELVSSPQSVNVQEPQECEAGSDVILDMDPNDHQVVKNEEAPEGIQAAEQADKTVSLTDGDDELVSALQTGDVQEPQECETISDVILDLDPDDHQIVKNEEAPEGIQADEQADKTVSLTDGDGELVSSPQTGDFQEGQGEAVSDVTIDFDPNDHQMVKNEEVPEGIQAAEQADKTVSLTDGDGKLVISPQTVNVQEPQECEAGSDVILDMDPNDHQVVKNEEAPEGIQAAEQADKTVSLTDGDDELVSALQTGDVQEHQECEAISDVILDLDPDDHQIVKNEEAPEGIQADEQADKTVSLTGGDGELVSSPQTGDFQEGQGEAVSDVTIDFDPNDHQMVKNEEVPEGIQAAEQADKTVSLTDGDGKLVSSPQTVNVQEPQECEAGSDVILDMDPNDHQVVKNEEAPEGIQAAEQADKTVSLTDGDDELVSALQTGDVQEHQECEAISDVILDLDPDDHQIVKNEEAPEGIQADEQADKTVSLTDGDGELVSSPQTGDFQEGQGEAVSDVTVDFDPNDHQMVKNEEAPEGIQAEEQADKTISLTDGNGELVSAPQTGDVQETQECEAVSDVILEFDPNNHQMVKNEEAPEGIRADEQAYKTISLTDGDGELVRAPQTGDVQEGQGDAVSDVILDFDPNDHQMVKNEEAPEDIQADEQADKTISLTDGDGELVSSPQTGDVQETQECEAVSDVTLDFDPNNHQMVKNEEAPEGIQAAEQADKTVSLTDGDVEIVSAPQTGDVQEPQECEAGSDVILDMDPNDHQVVKNEEAPEGIQAAEQADKTVSLTDADDELVSALQTGDVQEPQECEAISYVILDLDPDDHQIVKNEEAPEGIQADEQADKTVSLTDGDDELVSSPQTGDFQEGQGEAVSDVTVDFDPNDHQMVKNEEAPEGIQADEQADKTVSLTDGDGELVSSPQTGDFQEGQGEAVSDVTVDFDPNYHQMVKNEEAPEGIQAEEQADKTISLTDGNGELVSAPQTGDVQETQECEAVSDVILDFDPNNHQMVKNEEAPECIRADEQAYKTISLTDGDGELVRAPQTGDVQEGQGEAVSDVILDFDPNDHQMVKNEEAPEDIQADEQADKTISLTDGNGELVSSPQTGDVQETQECEAGSDVILDLDTNDHQMVKNGEPSEGIQPAEQADKTVSWTDGHGELVSAPQTGEVQEPKDCEAGSDIILDLDPNNHQMVKNDGQADKTVSFTESDGKSIEPEKEPRSAVILDFEFSKDIQINQQANEIVALANVNSEPTSVNKTEVVQYPEDSKVLSAIDLDSDPKKIKMLEKSSENIQAKPVDETVSLSGENGELLNAIKTMDVLVITSDVNSLEVFKSKEFSDNTQALKQTEDTVAQPDTNGERRSATITGDIQEKKESELALTSHSDESTTQMVKNEDFSREIQLAESTYKTTGYGNDGPMNATATNDPIFDSISISNSNLYNPQILKNNNLFENIPSSVQTVETLSLPEGRDEQESAITTRSNNLQTLKDKDSEDFQVTEPADITVSLTDQKGGKIVISTKIESNQEQKEFEREPGLILDLGQNSLLFVTNVTNEGLYGDIQPAKLARETLTPTDGNGNQVVSTKTEVVEERKENKEVFNLFSDSDPNQPQLVKNKDFSEGIEAEEPPDEIVSLVDSNGESVIATETTYIRKPKEMVKDKDFQECIQVSESTNETPSQIKDNGKTGISNNIEDVQEPKECQEASALILDLDPNELQMFQNDNFRESIQASEPADETVALTNGDDEPTIATTTKAIQESEKYKPGTTSIVDTKSNSLWMEKKPFFIGFKETEPANETEIPIDNKDESKSGTELKIDQEPELFEALPERGLAIEPHFFQSVDKVGNETESSTDNHLSVRPTEEPERFKVGLTTILDLELNPLLIPRERTAQHLSVIEKESKERQPKEPMNTTEMFQIVQEDSTVLKELKDQLNDESVSCTSKSNEDQIEPSNTEHAEETLEAVSAITSELKAEHSQFQEKEMILKNVPEAGINSCDRGPEQSSNNLEIKMTEDVPTQDIFRAVLVTILDSELSSLPSVTMDQGSVGMPANETFKSDDSKPVETPMVTDSEVTEVVEAFQSATSSTLFLQATTKDISFCKNELEIKTEPPIIDRAVLVEETTTGPVKEEHLVQEVDDVALSPEAYSNTLPKKREEPVENPGKAVLGEPKDRRAAISSGIVSVEEHKFSEAVETNTFNLEKNTLKTKETSESNQEGQRDRDEIVQGEIQQEIPSFLPSPEKIPNKSSDSGGGLTEPTHGGILSDLKTNSDKGKDNKLQVVKIKMAAIESTEMLQDDTDEVILDTVIEKLSDIQLPLMPGFPVETVFQETVETVTPSDPEAITETAEEFRNVVMMHVQSVEFNDDHKIQVQAKDIGIESAQTILELALEVGLKEINDVCQETVSEAETLSTTSEMKEEVIPEENKPTIEGVVPLTKEQPEEIHLDFEDKNVRVEGELENNTDMLAEGHTERPKDILQTPETSKSLDNIIYDEVLEETKAKKVKYEVDALAGAAKHSLSTPSTSTETLRALNYDEVSDTSVHTEDFNQLVQGTQTVECEQTEIVGKKTDLAEQANNFYSTEKTTTTSEPQEVKSVSIKTEESEGQLKSTGTPTLDVQTTDSIQPMSERETTKEDAIQLEHEKTAPDHLHPETEEDFSQDVWQDAMEDILTSEECDIAYSELQEEKEVDFEMSLVPEIEEEETQEPPENEEKGDTESEGEDFAVAPEELDNE